MQNMRYMVPVFDSEQTGDLMQTPDEVAAMLRQHELGWGAKPIARELGISKNTVKHYLRQGDWAAYRTPARSKALEAWSGRWSRAFFSMEFDRMMLTPDVADMVTELERPFFENPKSATYAVLTRTKYSLLCPFQLREWIEEISDSKFKNKPQF